MNTKLQKVTFYTCLAIILIFSVLCIYQDGRELEYEYRYYEEYTMLGDFHWHLVKWPKVIDIIC